MALILHTASCSLNHHSYVIQSCFQRTSSSKASAGDKHGGGEEKEAPASLWGTAQVVSTVKLLKIMGMSIISPQNSTCKHFFWGMFFYKQGKG